MRQIRIDPPRQTNRHAAPNPPRLRAPRCPAHPGVHMVLAGANQDRNTIRYVCPMCNQMGRPPIEVATGVVSGYHGDRGYGFIDNGGPRIFFHISDLAVSFTPYVGMPVTCQVAQNERGLIARQVRPL